MALDGLKFMIEEEPAPRTKSACSAWAAAAPTLSRACWIRA